MDLLVNVQTIDDIYNILMLKPKVENEHMEKLYEYAQKVDSIVEMGVYDGWSTVAMLKARKPMTSIDIELRPQAMIIEEIAKKDGIPFVLVQSDTLKVILGEKADLLYIDTLHIEEQLYKELSRHASNINKYIIMHDTQMYGVFGGGDPDIPETMNKRGLLFAILNFLSEHPEWELHEHVKNKCGLTVLKRKELGEDLNQYDNNFYRFNVWEGTQAADWFVPMLIKFFSPKTVVDVGCGCGHYLKKFHECNVCAHGIEGSQSAINNAVVGQSFIMQFDLRKESGSRSKYDLCYSIEVAEHLQPEYADIFVDTLCKLSDTIVITAATPGQEIGSAHHYNEQPHEYWVEKFEKRGYKLSPITDQLKDHIQQCTEDGYYVMPWFKSNIMVFKK